MTGVAIIIVAGLVLLMILAWLIGRLQARRREAQVNQRRIRQKGYRYAWDMVMGRKRHLMIEHRDTTE